MSDDGKGYLDAYDDFCYNSDGKGGIDGLKDSRYSLMDEIQDEDIMNYSEGEIVLEYLGSYSHSMESYGTRKTSLKCFFDKKYYGYTKEVYQINKRDIIGYFNYLNRRVDISINTKKVRWAIFKSFIQFCMEYYEGFKPIMPKKLVRWQVVHKEPKSNANIIMDKMEILKLLRWLKGYDSKHYAIYRIFAETGMRLGELININICGVNLERRYIKTIGKTGIKIYYISEGLRDILENIIKERIKISKQTTEPLFLSGSKRRYQSRALQEYLKKITLNVDVQKEISPKTFRSTLNTLRKKMGCSNEDRKMLLNHKTGDININHYVKLNYKDFIRLYDRWNPFKDDVI